MTGTPVRCATGRLHYERVLAFNEKRADSPPNNRWNGPFPGTILEEQSREKAEETLAIAEGKVEWNDPHI